MKSPLGLFVMFVAVGLLTCCALTAQTQPASSANLPPPPPVVQSQPATATPSSAFPTPTTVEPRHPEVNQQLPQTEQTDAPPQSPSQIASPPPKGIPRVISQPKKTAKK